MSITSNYVSLSPLVVSLNFLSDKKPLGERRKKHG